MVSNHTLFKTEKEKCLQWYVEIWCPANNWPAVPKLAQVQIKYFHYKRLEMGQRHCLALATT